MTRLDARLRDKLPPSSSLYAFGLATSAVAVAGVLVLHGYGFGPVPTIAALAVVAAIAERGRVRIAGPALLEVSIALLPTLVTAVLFGPLAAMAVGAASFLGHLRRPYLKWLAFTSSRALTWAVTGLLVTGLGGLSSNNFGDLVIGAGAGALCSETLDTLFAAVAYRLRGNGRMGAAARMLAPLAVAAVPFFAPVVVLLVLAYQRLSPWTLALFFVPGLGAQRLFVLYQEQRQLADDFASLNQQLERANLSFATALVATLDARDRYTAGHSAAVGIYARDIAARMGLSHEQQQLAHLCGLVHDIGKIGLPAGLLEKPGALTLEERRHMQEHSIIGERILANVDTYAEIAAIVRHHHERWDGGGYPDRLAADVIPLLSRIIAVADAYNAMTSARPYRDAMPSRVARMRLAQAVETQFDTAVVAAFEAVLAAATEEYRLGTRSDFAFGAQEYWSETSEMAA